MKNLKFAEALNSEVENIVENTKVSAAFVQELKEAFLMFPVRTDMRFKQILKRRTDYIGHSRLCYWHDTTF